MERSGHACLTVQRAQPRQCLLAIVVALLSLVVGAPGAGAQESTPGADSDIPAPAECTVAPRSADELRAAWYAARKA
jgi:hypothetical protein